MTVFKKRFSYSWVIVFLCALLMFISGFVGGYQGQWLSAVTEGMGFSRTAFSLNNSFRFATSAIMSLMFVMVLRRLGVRKTFAIGFVFMILAMVTYSVAEKVWQFYVGGTLFGIGLSLGIGSIISVLLKQWVTKGFGTIIGIVSACSGLGAAVGVRVMSPILFQEGNPLGFRDAYRLCAIILVVTGVLVVLLAKENKDRAQTVVSAPVAEKKKSGKMNKSAILFLIFVVSCVFLCNALLMGINSVYAAHMRDVGLNNDIVTWATSTLSIMLILSKTSIGAIFDKWRLRAVLIICQMATIISFALMTIMNAQSNAIAIIFAMIFPFALPLETVVISLIVEELFDKEDFTRVLGYTSAASSTGFAIGPVLVNKVYDIKGTYLPAIYFCMGLMAVILVAFQIAITIAHKKKRSVT